jgi:hypothetical protein
MHALNCLARETGDARAVNGKFVYRPSSLQPKRIYWKMSVNLSYPLVRSMGLHDALLLKHGDALEKRISALLLYCTLADAIETFRAGSRTPEEDLGRTSKHKYGNARHKRRP